MQDDRHNAERATDPDPDETVQAEAALLHAPVRDHLFSDRPVFTWHLGTQRIIGANPASTGLFGKRTLGDVIGLPLDPAQPGLRHLLGIGETLATDRPRVERLRLFAGFKAVTLTAMVARDGDAPDIVVVTAVDALATGLLPVDKARLIAPHLSGHGVIVDGDGTTLARVAADSPPRGGKTRIQSIPLSDAAHGIVYTRISSAPMAPPEPVGAEVDMPGAAPVPHPSPEAGKRFRIDLDEHGHVLTATPPLATLGLADPADTGRTLADLAGDHDPAAGAALDRKLAGHTSFSGLVLPWPEKDGAVLATVALAGLPTRNADGQIDGYRVFAAVEATAPLAAPGADAEPAVDAADMQAATDDAAEPPASIVPLAQPSTDRSTDQTTDDANDVTSDTPGDKAEEDRSGLEPQDRQAFEAIAAALTPLGGAVAAGAIARRIETPPDLDASETTAPDTDAPDDLPDRDDGTEGDEVDTPPAMDDDSDDAPLDTGPYGAGRGPIHSDLMARLGALFGATVQQEATAPDGVTGTRITNASDGDTSDDADADDIDAPVEIHPAMAPAAAMGAVPQITAGAEAGLASIDLSSAFIDLVERLPVGLLFFRENEALHANQAFLALFGYADLDDLEIAGGVSALFENYARLDGAEGVKRVLHGVTRDGDPVDVDARMQLARWVDGPAMLLSARERAKPDLSQLIAAKSDAIDLANTLELAADGVVLFDDSGAILSATDDARALFGYPADALEGQPVLSLFAPDARAEAEARLSAVRQKSGPRSDPTPAPAAWRTTGRGQDGSEIALKARFGSVGAERNSRYAAVFHKPETDTAISDTAPPAADLAPMAANRRQSEFLARVSHEIRTPLNAIIGFAEVMMDERFGPIGNPRYRDYVADIRNSGEHMMSLVNDLLDLSKVESGRLDLTLEALDLNEIAERCVAMMQADASRARVVLRSSLSPALPPVTADARSVRQILLNLLSNAIKFTGSGGQVIVSTLVEADGIAMRVRDTGKGMSEREIQDVLDPFRQVRDTTGQDGAGSGIGLPLTRALAAANRATLSIDSKPGQGTLVAIRFANTGR